MNYNVMGVAKAALEASTRYLAADLGKNNIRVNAISAGPDKHALGPRRQEYGLAARLRWRTLAAQTERTASEVGNTALFLVSDLASGITGETIYVDCGYNIMGI